MNKQVFADSFSELSLPSIKFELGPLNFLAASRALFAKIKTRLEHTVKFNDIARLVEQKTSLQSPKAIETLCQSLTGKKKLKLEAVEDKIKQIGDDESAANELVK